MPVSVLLVSHNGARWLPAVLAGVEQQTCTHRPAGGTRHRLRRRVRRHPAARGLVGRPPGRRLLVVRRGGAGRTRPDPAASDGTEPDWVWLLHDDSAPDPEALEQLLTAATEHPEVAIFGPKLREWPSLRRLLELGVTISGTGRRETGLERGEYDQGQHDERRIVLAVNTAGMLVRRDVLDELGFDPALRFFGNDLDFGWRAARAGHSAMVVPEALVFHAEAAHRGQRTFAAARHPHRDERQAALTTPAGQRLLAGVPFRVVRLSLGTVLRVLGLLLVRAPREAWDEIVALASVVGRPGRLAGARRARRRTQRPLRQEVEHLLAPPWLPYRHGMDFVADVGSAAVDVAREAVGGRTVRSADLVDADDMSASRSADCSGCCCATRGSGWWSAASRWPWSPPAACSPAARSRGVRCCPLPTRVSHWWGT